MKDQEKILNDLFKIDCALPKSWDLKTEEGEKLLSSFRKQLEEYYKNEGLK